MGRAEGLRRGGARAAELDSRNRCHETCAGQKEKGGSRSERDNGQVGDFLKVPQIGSEHGIPLFDRCGGDRQVVKRQHISLRCFLPLDLAHEPPGCLLMGWTGTRLTSSSTNRRRV